MLELYLHSPMPLYGADAELFKYKDTFTMTFRNRMKTCETENPYPGIKGKKNSVA
jgi:hypothetical protein